MRNLVRIMSIAALVALVVMACDQHAVEPGKAPGIDNSFAKDGGVSLLEVTCETCTGDNGLRFPSSGVVGFANLGNYCAWAPKRFRFCPSDSAQVQFEGQFGSFVRGVNGWNVDLVPIGTVVDWCDVVTGIKYEHDSPGTSPTCNSNSPSNVVGADGNLFAESYGYGYYSYDQVNNVITSYDYDIVVWKDNGGNTTDITTADLAYVLTVTAAPTPGAGGYFSSVDFSWFCVTPTTCLE